eukprot:TRINITY_DN11975_c0_g1_i1.p1 TRINITY_DN11975_c0_g1~~TRINITY_DN11975_c0_g1_i1.p1  ORF type:complete len:373 (+),score=157.61 TRINITY_DN11975_c0_g1_i1:30-1121(+)
MTYDKVDKPTTVNQRSIDELERRLQSMIELKTGWAEPHKLSRELQRMFKIYDIDNTGTMSLDEFEKALVKLNIGGTDAEVEALFDRYDTNENGVLSFAEFTDGLFSVKPCPLADEQCRVVLKRIQDRIITRTGGTTRGLSRSIRIMDKDKSNSLSFEELKTGLERAGVRIDDNEMKVIMKHFDRDNDNKVSVTEFMRGVRGPLSPRRKNLVIAAYYILDKNRDQRITLAEISSVYDVSRHPLVVNGTKTQEEVLKDFISDWDKDGDGVVLLEEWLDYYKDISAGIDNDDYFELMMRNAWHLPGGEGWCANTANLRVLVKHTDGRQTVQTLKSDLGIKPSDTSKIKKQLVAQGIKDIKSIEVTG